MAYLGNRPAESYASFETETFSVSATTNYTLSHAVTNENEIRLVINGVVQQPGSGKAYTASGTTLTLSSATASGDSMYAVYLGRALQTVNPPAASVGNSQTAPTIITGQTAETSIATDDTILIHDTSASALRKMTRANFVSGIGGDNTPSFMAELSSNQNIATATETTAIFNSEIYDTDNAYNTSTGKFTAPEDGKYLFVFGVRKVGFTSARFFAELKTQGSPNNLVVENASNDTVHGSAGGSIIVNMSSGNEAYINVYHNNGSQQAISSDVSFFGAMKLIGV